MFDKAKDFRLAVRCTKHEQTMLGALEIVAVNARLAVGERKIARMRLLADMLELHGELFGFGAKEEAECFVNSLSTPAPATVKQSFN